MFAKFERRDFLLDVPPLLSAEKRARFDKAAGIEAFRKVFETFIIKIPGNASKSAPSQIEQHGLDIKIPSGRKR